MAVNVRISSFLLDTGRYLYLRGRAISAGETYGYNDNGDWFGRDELKKAVSTFINAGVYVNHNSYDLRNSIGIILDAAYIDILDDNTGDYIELIFAIDKRKAEDLFPGIIKAIESGSITDLSMGCWAQEAECSICKNIATSMNTTCEHVRNFKGQKFEGKPVYEINRGLSFFEISLIFEPSVLQSGVGIGIGADQSAKILQHVAFKNEVIKGGIKVAKNGNPQELLDRGDYGAADTIDKATYDLGTKESEKDRVRGNPMVTMEDAGDYVLGKSPTIAVSLWSKLSPAIRKQLGPVTLVPDENNSKSNYVDLLKSTSVSPNAFVSRAVQALREEFLEGQEFVPGTPDRIIDLVTRKAQYLTALDELKQKRNALLQRKMRTLSKKHRLAFVAEEEKLNEAIDELEELLDDTIKELDKASDIVEKVQDEGIESKPVEVTLNKIDEALDNIATNLDEITDVLSDVQNGNNKEEKLNEKPAKKREVLEENLISTVPTKPDIAQSARLAKKLRTRLLLAKLRARRRLNSKRFSLRDRVRARLSTKSASSLRDRVRARLSTNNTYDMLRQENFALRTALNERRVADLVALMIEKGLLSKSAAAEKKAELLKMSAAEFNTIVKFVKGVPMRQLASVSSQQKNVVIPQAFNPTLTKVEGLFD